MDILSSSWLTVWCCFLACLNGDTVFDSNPICQSRWWLALETLLSTIQLWLKPHCWLKCQKIHLVFPSQAAVEGTISFLSQAAHIQVIQVCNILAYSLHKHAAAHWSLYHETQLSQTRLVVELIPTGIVLKSVRQVSDSDAAAVQMSLRLRAILAPCTSGQKELLWSLY